MEGPRSVHVPKDSRLVAQATGTSSKVLSALFTPRAIAGLQKRIPIRWRSCRSASDKSGYRSPI